LTIWNTVKGKPDSAESLERLIQECDLAKKRNMQARSLSGGMKRKLQLACMLVGGSTVCFADEITSGLDPLSRRVIWEVIKRERARRTMVLTTHFLDESEVLSDHIVIITLGKMKCQGTPAELKTKYGGGYRVHIPKTEDISSLDHPVAERHDRYICRTPDSSSAARVLASLKTARDSEIYITGPTVEDVFLKVAEEPHALIGESPEAISVDESLASRTKAAEPEMSLTKLYSRQIGALFLKRIFLLRSTWWQYLFALAIPIAVAPTLTDYLLDYKIPNCTDLVASPNYPDPFRLYSSYYLALGPESINATVSSILTSQFGSAEGTYYNYNAGPFVLSSREQLESFVHTNSKNLSYGGAIWAGNDSKPLVAYEASNSAVSSALLNLVNQVRSGVTMKGYLSELTSYSKPEGEQSFFWITVFCLVHALYPAFFSLYPTYERRSQVRALQYSNGIRPFPILVSYWLFDAIFVIIIAAVCTPLIAPQAHWFGIGYLFLVQVLFGFAATLFSYLISFVARTQPSAFAFSIILHAIMYALSVVTFLVGNPHLIHLKRTIG
jgi:hypothetical protein